MIDADSFDTLQRAMTACVDADRHVLDGLRADVRPLTNAMRRIQPRATTAISLVGTDGGNNQVKFDPFMVQIVRVVDSSENEYCLEVVSPNTDVSTLSRRHITPSGEPLTLLGRLMGYLGVKELCDLSPMVPRPGQTPKPSWVQVYRELMEWAVLFDVVRERQYASDTVIVCDGFLRSKVFAKDMFTNLRRGLDEGIERQFLSHRRRIYVAGVAKSSKVLQTYRVAMALENVLRTAYPSFVEVPARLERLVYEYGEFARDEEHEIGRAWERYVAGVMFFVKFGARPHDPVWAIDVLLSQRRAASTVFGYLLADAQDGFPIPFYPQCLQRAHEAATLVGFDITVLQDQIFFAMRKALGSERFVLDEFELESAGPSTAGYE